MANFNIKTDSDISSIKWMMSGSHKRFICRYIDTIAKTGPGTFKGTIREGESRFELVGGKESGGRKTEWFLWCPLAFGEGNWVKFNSGAAALRAINEF